MAPRPGMVWIEQGTLRAGTPLERVPRLPDAELAGQPFELTGFFIDVFPHPNEPGAIPTTNVTRQVAQELCESAGKRLCTELELERACKGPDNWAYPYGGPLPGGRVRHRARRRLARCRTGSRRRA
jgi:sulfatase modifying factor 1